MLEAGQRWGASDRWVTFSLPLIAITLPLMSNDNITQLSNTRHTPRRPGFVSQSIKLDHLHSGSRHFPDRPGETYPQRGLGNRRVAREGTHATHDFSFKRC